MAKYTVTYECGHEGVVNLFGKSEAREKTLAYLATVPCPKCQHAETMASHAEANQQAAAYSEEHQLPILKGTEKQVAWANTIRKSMIEAVEKAVNPSDLMKESLVFVHRYSRKNGLPDIADKAYAEDKYNAGKEALLAYLQDKYEEGKAAFLEHLKAETKATYFINTRNEVSREFGKYLVAAYYEKPLEEVGKVWGDML